jgi:hypothetical protein
VEIGSDKFRAKKTYLFDPNTIPNHFFAFADGSQNSSVPLQIVDLHVVLSSPPPNTSALVQQNIPLSLMVVTDINLLS